MHSAEPLNLPQLKLAEIKRLAASAQANRGAEKYPFRAISQLPEGQRSELLALVMLGRGGHRSFNVALNSAKKQNAGHIAEALADDSRLAIHLKAGIKRYNRQGA